MHRTGLASLLAASGVALAVSSAAFANDSGTGRRSGDRGPGSRVAVADPIGQDAASSGFSVGTPIADGSFEKGPPPGSDWSEVTNTPTACPSGIWDWSAEFEAASPDGSMSYWGGGYCPTEPDVGAIEGWVEQDVTVPASTPVLVFWYLAVRGMPDESAGSDVAFVDVNGAEQWSLDVSTAANNTDDGGPNLCYVPARIDLAAFAGQTIELRVGFDADTTGEVGNVVFDDFTFADLISADGFECGMGRWSATTP